MPKLVSTIFCHFATGPAFHKNLICSGRFATDFCSRPLRYSSRLASNDNQSRNNTVQYLMSSIFATLFFFTFSMSLHAATPISGAWLLTVDGPRGKSTPTLTILEKAPGEFSGALAGPKTTIAIDAIEVVGNSFSFPFQMKTAFGTFELTYTGQIDQDTMNGSIATPRGNRHLTGQRQSAQ